MDDHDWQASWHSFREILGAKWSVHILRLLMSRSHGFNELKHEIDGMTATMLSRRLKELTCHGFVDRTVEETTPPTTTYRLTQAGIEFARLLLEMEELAHVREMNEATCEKDCGGVSDITCVDDGLADVCVTIATD